MGGAGLGVLVGAGEEGVGVGVDDGLVAGSQRYNTLLPPLTLNIPNPYITPANTDNQSLHTNNPLLTLTLTLPLHLQLRPLFLLKLVHP